MLWLRDLLPDSAPFEQSRIMTFGYDSTLINRKSNNRINDWADELLYQLGYLRTHADDQQKPIIFICHSLVSLGFCTKMHILIYVSGRAGSKRGNDSSRQTGN